MATWNSGNSSYQSGNKTLFEVQMLATPDGVEVSNTNPLPVTLGNATIEITGSNVNVTIPNTVVVNSSPENPVHVHISEVGNSGLLNVSYVPGYGNVNIFQSNGGVINNTTPLPVTGNLTISSISSNVVVSVNNWPTTQNVSFANQSVTITGNIAAITANVVVSVNNWPTYQNTYIHHSNGSNITNTDPLPVTASIIGNVNVIPYMGVAGSTTAYGEAYGITITPVILLDAIYGITDEVIQTYNSGTGSSANATPLSGLFQVQKGTDAYGYGVLRSRRFLRYRAGQGALCRFTASFTPNTALTTQRTGLFNQENAIMVGWNDDGSGPKFGVMRASGGKTEVRQLTINSISTGSQTLTVTLNGVAFTVTGVNTSNTTAAAVAIANRVGGYTGWLIDQVDNTVLFMSSTLGSKNGTYSLTGSGTVSGTFAQRQVGVAQTEHWTYQNNFNVDKLDGTGPSGMTLHSEYLNVYQINYRWLGAGIIRYAIEDQTTGNMVLFHVEHYTNQNNIPHIANPSFKIGYIAYSLGSTTNVTVSGASIMGAIEGDIRQNELNRSTESIKTSLNNTGTLFHLATIRNPYVTNGKAAAYNGHFILNSKEIILKDISVGVQGSDPAIVYLFYNAKSFSGTHSYLSQPKDNAMISIIDGTFDKTIDTAIARFVTAINGEAQYKLNEFRIAIPAGDSISIAIASSSNMSRVSCALVFSED